MKLATDTRLETAGGKELEYSPRIGRVLHVIPSVGPLRGGPSMMVRNLARKLAERGVETHVATTDDNGPGRLDVPRATPVVEDGVTYWYFPRQFGFYTFSWPLTTWLQRHVAGFDLVHVHALFSYAALPASYWARKRGVPYIVRPLGTLNEWGMQNRRRRLKHLSFRWMESRILKHAAAVHYTSDQERREAERLGVDAPARIIPNALPDEPTGAGPDSFYQRYPDLRGRRIVLFLSRLDAKKGLDLLLPAFAGVLRSLPDAALVVAGQGDREFTENLRAQAAVLGIDRAITWAGFLGGESKQAALAAAELFVLPSYSENFGIAVAEAMAAGLPVVVSDQVAIQSDVARSESGLVIPCEVSALEAALLRLLSDADLRRSMGSRGRTFAETEYSSAAVTDRMIVLYNEVIQGKTRT